MSYKVFVRDVPGPDGRMPLVGEVDTWLKLDFTVRHNAPGNWLMLVSVGSEQEKLLRQGRGVVVFQEGLRDPVFSGTIDAFERNWSNDQHTGAGSLHVSGKCDNQLPHNYLSFPSTTGTGEEMRLRGIDKQWEGADRRPVGGLVGRVVWQECDLAFGPRALLDRKLPHVDVGPNPSEGVVVRDTLRYDNLGSRFAKWLQDKNTGYRFLYDPKTQKIRLRVFQCRDLGRIVRFSPELGNIKRYSWQLQAPTVTRAVVACQGEGRDRYIYQAADVAAEYAWYRIVEQFIDRRDIPLKTVRGRPELVVRINDDGSEDLGTGPTGRAWPGDTFGDRKDAAIQYYLSMVKEAAHTALKEGERTGHFQIFPVDTPQCMFGRDYRVGDVVTVEADSRRITERVNEVTITVEHGGEGVVSPKIGNQGTGQPVNIYREVAGMRERIRRLEAQV